MTSGQTLTGVAGGFEPTSFSQRESWIALLLSRPEAEQVKPLIQLKSAHNSGVQGAKSHKRELKPPPAPPQGRGLRPLHDFVGECDIEANMPGKQGGGKPRPYPIRAWQADL